MDKEQQQFEDNLTAKSLKAQFKDRSLNTEKIIKAINDKEVPIIPEFPPFPTIPETDLTETNNLLSKLIEESQKPCQIKLTLKLK